MLTILKWIAFLFAAVFALRMCASVGEHSGLGGSKSIGTGAYEKAPKQRYKTTAQQLFADYEANEVATDEKIKDKVIEISGTVESISKDFTDSIVISLRTSNRFMSANLHVNDSQKPVAMALRKGTDVTLLCNKMRQIIGSPSGSDCEFLSHSSSSTAPLPAREPEPTKLPDASSQLSGPTQNQPTQLQSAISVEEANGKGMDALEKKDYAEALRWFRIAADGGFAKAQYNIGVLYTDGLGVPKNYATAERWYRKAADLGFAPAQYNLGVLYESGAGVPKDEEQARYWYYIAADQGSEDAKKALAELDSDRALSSAKDTPPAQPGSKNGAILPARRANKQPSDRDGPVAQLDDARRNPAIVSAVNAEVARLLGKVNPANSLNAYFVDGQFDKAQLHADMAKLSALSLAAYWFKYPACIGVVNYVPNPAGPRNEQRQPTETCIGSWYTPSTTPQQDAEYVVSTRAYVVKAQAYVSEIAASLAARR